MAQLKNNPITLDNTTKLFGVHNQVPGEVDVNGIPTMGVGGRLRNIIYMTVSGTYSKPSWLKFVIVKGVSGGGGGGGAAVTTSAQRALGAGAQSGAYFEKKIAAATLLASETVTIGLGGGGGVAGANDGLPGGTTSFGTHCSATGGGQGIGSAAVANTGSTAVSNYVTSVATGGDINIKGSPGLRSALTLGKVLSPGMGAGGVLGGWASSEYNSNGSPGELYGGGGAGAYNAESQSARDGGAGAPGIVIIEEYE